MMSQIINNLSNLSFSESKKYENFKIESYILNNLNRMDNKPDFKINTSENLNEKISFDILTKELNRIQDEVNLTEKRVKELQIIKNFKIAKVDDLRMVINRIANEDNFNCYFRNKHVNVKSKEINAKKNNVSDIDMSHMLSFNTSDETEADECKEAISSDDSCSSSAGDHLLQCLQYWQDNLPNPFIR